MIVVQEPDDVRPRVYAVMCAQSWRWQQNKRSKGGGHAAPSLGRPDVVKDDRKTVYVKNLPYRATEDDIIGFFSQAGPVADVRRGAEADGVPIPPLSSYIPVTQPRHTTLLNHWITLHPVSMKHRRCERNFLRIVLVVQHSWLIPGFTAKYNSMSQCLLALTFAMEAAVR